MDATTIAVDLAKNVFELAVADGGGRIRAHHRLGRARLLPFFSNLPQSSSCHCNWRPLDGAVPAALQPGLNELLAEIAAPEQRCTHIERQLRSLTQQDVVVQQLLGIPGVGSLTYLRTLLIHGARAVLNAAQAARRRGQSLDQLRTRANWKYERSFNANWIPTIA